MAKLSSPPSRISTPSVKLNRQPDPDRKRRYHEQPEWRKWYSTKEWKALRWEALKRDGFICRMCGRSCGGKYPADNSPVADHIKPHRGLRELFFDLDNIQTLCKAPCHDSVKQKEERRMR